MNDGAWAGRGFTRPGPQGQDLGFTRDPACRAEWERLWPHPPQTSQGVLRAAGLAELLSIVADAKDRAAEPEAGQ